MSTLRSNNPIRPLCNSEENENEINENNDDVEIDEDEREFPELEESDADDVADECRVPEARKVKVLRDPGAPTQTEIDEHNMTHLPFRPWCPSCIAGQARDKHHKKSTDQDKAIDEIVFDYGFFRF